VSSLLSDRQLRLTVGRWVLEILHATQVVRTTMMVSDVGGIGKWQYVFMKSMRLRGVFTRRACINVHTSPTPCRSSKANHRPPSAHEIADVHVDQASCYVRSCLACLGTLKSINSGFLGSVVLCVSARPGGGLVDRLVVTPASFSSGIGHSIE